MVAIIVGASIIAFAILLPMILQLVGQPNIVLTETAIDRRICFSDYTFTIVNSGVADGFANVQFLMDGTVVDNSNYFVPAGSSAQKIQRVSDDDCFSQTASMRIASTWKG